MPKPFNVFISYAHQDITSRKELDNHLSILKVAKIINVWTNSDISPGTNWEAQIQEQLDHAQIILLLISVDFLASPFCQSVEMAKAIERHKANTARVIPIILRDVMWDVTPLGQLQALPRSSENRPRPVASWSQTDEAWKNIAQGIYAVANELEQKEKAAGLPRIADSKPAGITQGSLGIGRRIALLIGNTEYDDQPYYRKLVTPGQNVRDLERILKDPERCGFEVTTLTNTSKANADKHIFNLFKNKTPNDFLVLYFAGHGLKDSDGALYFAMKETERDAIEATAVSASFVKKCIDKSLSERIVIILDCCFSGAFGATMSGYGETIDIQREFESHGYGCVVLTATDAMQYAWDRSTNEVIGEADHSVFTRYLIEGIRTGEADRDDDGEITIDDLFSYIYQQTVKTFPKQTPKKIVYQSASDLVFARNPTPNKLSRDLLSDITHPNHRVRFAVVDELEEWLYLYNENQNQQLVEQIQNALKKLAHDRNAHVSKQASFVLDTFDNRNTSLTGLTRHLTLFIASPSDVITEREIVSRVVEKLNRDESIGSQAQISIVEQDDADTSNAIPDYLTSQTKSHAEGLRPSACDIVVVIFWSQMGNPAPIDAARKDGTSYESKTEWEYEDAVNAAKHNNGRPTVLLYRSNKPVIRPGEINLQEKFAQFQKIEHFFSRFSGPDNSFESGYHFYENIGQFATELEQHLRVVIRRLAAEVTPVHLEQPEQEAQSVMPEDVGDVNELLKPYLNWMIEQHSRLELRGLGGDAQLPTIPLEKVYVALKGVRASTYEREQSQELLRADTAAIIAQHLPQEVSAAELAQIMPYAERRAIVINSYMLSILARDRPGEAENILGEKVALVTLGDAFRQERWMIILGDPGSGKTTLARWIALKLASALLNDEGSVNVPAYQVDPKVAKSDDKMIDLGPARLPILLKVSEFADAYQKARKNLETLSIVDFLGYHSWLGQSPNLSQQKLNALIKQYLQQGRAVVILDGIDEITVANQRDDVVRSIETFINDWVNAKGDVISAQEKSFLWNPKVQGPPVTVGGNQILITSRIVGYQAKPITGQVTHVTIQPMQQVAVEHFCDAWTVAIHQLLSPNENAETVQSRAESEASGLKATIFDPDRPRVQELASNPLLITILALVYRNNQGRIPEQRAELYQKAMEILVETWRITGMTTVELVYVLSPLAARMHQQYSTGLIEESEMQEIITEALAEYRRLDVFDLPPSFALEVDAFIRKVQEDVGLLSERSKGLYGFLHLTFQEYLAALYLVRNPRSAPHAIIDKLDDSRWREPILMALGHISVKWGSKARQRLLTALLNADDPLGGLVPRSALLIVSAIPEMADIAEDVVYEIIRRLLTTYANREGSGQFSVLRERISSSLKNLHSSNHRHLLEQHLEKTILDIEKGDRNLALASALLIAENKWQSDPLIKALIKAFPYDDPKWKYPITRALSTALLFFDEVSSIPIKPEIGQKDKQELERLEKIINETKNQNTEEDIKTRINAEANISQIKEKYDQQLSEYQRQMAEYQQHLREKQSSLPIDSDTLPFRKSLEKEPELVEYIQHNLSWLCLVVLLYGGISDNGFATYVIQYYEIAALLQLEDPLRLYYIDQLRAQEYWKAIWDSDDVVYALAVYLDTECGKLSKMAAKHIPQFTPLAILNDSPLTTIVLNALRQKKHPSTLKNRLWQEWRTASNEIRRVHALLVLLVIDTQQAINTLTQSLKDTAASALAEMVLNQLRQRKHTLADVLILLGKRSEIGQSLKPLQDKLADDQWGDLVELFFRTFTSVMPFPVGYDDVLLAKATSIPRINAEIWTYWLSGLSGDDHVYNYAVILDTIGKKLKSASALINIQVAHNVKYDKFTQWHSLPIPPQYDNYQDIVGEALTIAHQSRSEVMGNLFHSGTMVYAGINYQDYPEMKTDALAATLLIPFEHQVDVINELDAELLKVEFYEESIYQIIKRVVSIADPVIRSRALWRVAQYRNYWRNLSFWDLAIEAAEQIVDPLHQSRAFERLINYVPRKQSERIKNEALNAARNITNPNNRSRALARLSLYEGDVKRWSLLAEALTAVKEITSEQEQVDTMHLIHPYLVGNHQLNQIYHEIIKEIENDWSRSKASNLLSIQLLELHDQLYEPHKLTSVIISAFIDDIVALMSQETSSEDLWKQLLDASKRERAIAALLQTASANNLAGLYLTPNVFDVIRSLLDAEEITTIHRLLPYLRGVEPSLLSSLNIWVDNSPDKALWAYAGLLLAEAGQVNPNTILCLIELVKNGIDFGRYRASIVLHGSTMNIDRKNRDFRTSQLGEQSLLLLDQAQKQLMSEMVSIATPIAWTWHNVIHDDPAVLQQLIQYSDTEDGVESSILDLLGRISHCEDDCLNALIDQFEKGSEKTQELLLNSWLLLSRKGYSGNITPEQSNRMEEAISKLPSSILENIKVIPNRLDTISNLLYSMSKRIEEEKITFQEATFVLDQELSALALRIPKASVDRISQDIFYYFGDDPQKALKAAEVVSENGPCLELLFTWLATCLRENINDFPLIYYRTSTLLELAGATTHFSPSAIYNLIERNKLGQPLIDAVMHHRRFSGRAGAAQLLGYIRQTPASFDEALLSGLQDFAEVQTAIMQMVQNSRYLDEQMIPKFLSLLEHESASVVYAVSKLLVSIARNEKTLHSVRQRIVRALNNTIQRRDSSRPVFVLNHHVASIFIRNIGRLDQQLYGDLINSVGVV